MITPIQLTMAISLGQVFGITLDYATAQAACASGAAMTVGRTAAQVLCGWVPGIGNAVNAGTAFTITEAIGWILARQFDNQSCSLKQAYNLKLDKTKTDRGEVKCIWHEEIIHI